jgi:hypothetical protein
MHTLIPFAAASGPQCQKALEGLKLPHLEKLLQRLRPQHLVEGETDALTPLHERIAAQSAGLTGPDGLISWAAQDAKARGLTSLHGQDGWAWITPCHWTVHADHVVMADPAHMSLTAEDYETLWGAMEPYFAEDGITLFAHTLDHPTRSWLAHGAVFRDLPTASLDRVAGQKVDSWMPRQAQAKTLRRLQNEMQMLLYTHPLNDERAKYKLLSINSFWVSGTGTPAETPQPTTALAINTALRAGALADDPAQWAFAWHALDASLIKETLEGVDRGEEVHISLCGERSAVTLQHRETSLWSRLTRRLSDPQALALLKTL